MDKSKSLDRLENAMSAYMRTAKRPAYWAEFERRAKINIDRPAAAILFSLANQSCQFLTLVNQLGVEAPSISRKVHELVQKGLIIRSQQTDKRIYILKLSDSGMELANKLKLAKRSLLKDLFSEWTLEERDRLADMLEKLADDLNDLTNRPKSGVSL